VMTNENTVDLTRECGSYAISFSGGECRAVMIRPSQINKVIRAGYLVEIDPRLHPDFKASAKHD